MLRAVLLDSALLAGGAPPQGWGRTAGGWGGRQSFICPPHGSQDGLNHPPCPPSHQREKLSSTKLFPGTKKAGGCGSTPHPSLSALLPNVFRIQPGLIVVSLWTPVTASHLLSGSTSARRPPQPHPAGALHATANGTLLAGESSGIPPLLPALQHSRLLRGRARALIRAYRLP